MPWYTRGGVLQLLGFTLQDFYENHWYYRSQVTTFCWVAHAGAGSTRPATCDGAVTYLTWLGQEAFYSRVALVPGRTGADGPVLDYVAACARCAQVSQPAQVLTHSLVTRLHVQTLRVPLARHRPLRWTPWHCRVHHVSLSSLRYQQTIPTPSNIIRYPIIIIGNLGNIQTQLHSVARIETIFVIFFQTINFEVTFTFRCKISHSFGLYDQTVNSSSLLTFQILIPLKSSVHKEASLSRRWFCLQPRVTVSVVHVCICVTINHLWHFFHTYK